MFLGDMEAFDVRSGSESKMCKILNFENSYKELRSVVNQLYRVKLIGILLMNCCCI